MDKALKQRLVGASVLIALAVIVLPMLLGGRPESDTRGSEKIELPQQPPELSFETRRYPIAESGESDVQKDPQREQATPATSLPVPRNNSADLTPQAETVNVIPPETSPAGNGEETEPGAEKADQVPVLEEPVSKPPSDALPPDDTGRYIVQVASFATVDNANRLSDTLGNAGYSVMTDSIKSEVGTLHRVRVGPYESETQANLAVTALESSIDGVKPRVMDLQPEQTAQVTTPSDPLVRWVVQVGSFSSAANAENLVASLKLEGQNAYQEIITSSGSEIYRVRIGPFLVRGDAIQAERRVRERMKLPGVVMSAD